MLVLEILCFGCEKGKGKGKDFWGVGCEDVCGRGCGGDGRTVQ